MCWQAYCRWNEERDEKLAEIERDLLAKIEERRSRGEDTSLSVSFAAPHQGNRDGDPDALAADPPSEIVASSVPRDWSWSTF
jgi:hypothetical protein